MTALALHGFLIQRLDQQLTAAGDRFSTSLEGPDDHDADNRNQFGAVEGKLPGRSLARVVPGKITVVQVVPRDADDSRGSVVSTEDRIILEHLARSTRPRTIHLPELGEYRVTVLAGDDDDLLITGLPEHPVEDIIARLLLIEGSVFAGALIVTGTVATASVRLSLRPLNRIAATAHAVSTLPLSTGMVTLSKRVEVSAPNTESGQVADAFNRMLEHVEAALRDRHASEDRLRHFIADASHELRTPIAVDRSRRARWCTGRRPGP